MIGDPLQPDDRGRQTFESLSRHVFKAIGLCAENHAEGAEARRLWVETDEAFNSLRQAREL